MADKKVVKSIIRLRRDNEVNYQKIKDTFVPQNGELCLVDTDNAGLRVICGNGVSKYSQLSFMDDFLIYGYYLNGEFYDDNNKTHMLTHNIKYIYVDKNSYLIYTYIGNKYQLLSSVPAASKDVQGILKLYDELGNNTDGTITQKVITEALNKKVEMIVDGDNETLQLFDGQ